MHRVSKARRDPLDHAQVEVDDVPARDHVGVEGTEALRKEIEGGELGRAAGGALRHGAVGAVDDEHLVDTGGKERNGQESFALGIRFDVEGEHARLGRYVGRAQHGIVEYPGESADRSGLALDLGAALDLATAFDAALDQIADGEAHVGFEGFDAAVMQAVT